MEATPQIINGLIQIPVKVSGMWEPKPKRDWNGVAVADEPIVAVVFLEVPEVTEWCISDKSSNSTLPVRIVLFNYDDLGLNAQVNISIGNSDGNRRLNCTLPELDYVPKIPNHFTVTTGEIFQFTFLDTTPKVFLKGLFVVRRDVKIYRDGIWHIRKELIEKVQPPFDQVLNRGRTGKIISKAG